MARRRIWFEFSWRQGAWPVSSEGWTLYLGAPAVCLVLLGIRQVMQTLMPGSWLNAIPLVLMVLVGLATNVLIFTHTQAKGQPRETEINQTARRLFRGQPWRIAIGGGRPPKPLVPDWPPRED